MASQKSSSSSCSSSVAASAAAGDSSGVKPVKLSYHEMLCYGHKISDNDYSYWKKTLENAFTKGERQAAARSREARASKTTSSNEAKSSSSSINNK